MKPEITISLTEDEALVLFERLAELDDQDALPVSDHAEELVFWRIQGQLEKAISVVFDPDYKQFVTEAKNRIIATE